MDFPDVGCYATWISVARTLPTVEVYSKSLGPADYHIIGTKKPEVFPACRLIPDTPCFLEYKPIPAKNKLVSVTGFLTGVERNNSHIEHFTIDVDQVVFSQLILALKAESKVSGTPARLKFTGFFGSQDSDNKFEEPSTKKRKTADDQAAEEANDKGQGLSSGHCQGGRTN
ncbi:hypothetical protein C8J57DRAFT_1547584 [Mycena rebaudengoi]|nr:hypothetical protein C8J57DRAFT_1547584 [Mycena rebaudengoi]